MSKLSKTLIPDTVQTVPVASTPFTDPFRAPNSREVLELICEPVFNELSIPAEERLAFYAAAVRDQTSGSPMRALDDALYRQLMKSMARASTRETHVVRYVLTAAEQMRLEAAFAEFKLEYTNQYTSDHSYHRVVRMLEHRVLAKKLSMYPKVTDIGGSKEMHGNYVMPNLAHICAPMFDLRDMARHIQGGPTSRVVQTSGDVDVVSAFRHLATTHSDNGDGVGYVCSHPGENCRYACDALMFVDSTYDIPFENLGAMMDAHGSRFGAGAMLLPPELLSSLEHPISTDDGVYMELDSEDKTKVVMSFVDSNSYSYVHDRENLTKYMFPALIETPHYKYLYSVDERRGSLVFFSIRVLEPDIKYDLSKLKRYVLSDKAPKVRIKTKEYDQSKSMHDAESYKDVVYEVDQSLWVAATQFAFTVLSKPEHDPQSVARYFKSLLHATTYNGVRLTPDGSAYMRHVSTLATAAYVYAAKTKMATDAYLAQLKEIADAVREDAATGRVLLRPVVWWWRDIKEKVIAWFSTGQDWIGLRALILRLAASYRSREFGFDFEIEADVIDPLREMTAGWKAPPALVGKDQLISPIVKTHRRYDDIASLSNVFDLENLLDPDEESNEGKVAVETMLADSGDVLFSKEQGSDDVAVGPVLEDMTDPYDGTTALEDEDMDAEERVFHVGDAIAQFTEILSTEKAGITADYQKYATQLFTMSGGARVPTGDERTLENSHHGVKTENLFLLGIRQGEDGVVHVVESRPKKPLNCAEYQYAYSVTHHDFFALNTRNSVTTVVMPADVRTLSGLHWLIIGNSTKLMNFDKLRDGARFSALHNDKLVKLKMTVVDAAPGAGKTTFILQNATIHSLVLTYARNSKDEIYTKLKAKIPGLETHSVATLDSALMHDRSVHNYDKVFVDEAFMAHPGQIYATLIKCLGARSCEGLQVMLVGDTRQIPYINRTPMAVEVPKIHEGFILEKQRKFTTYRMPLDVAATLNHLYENRLKTLNHVKRSMKAIKLGGGVQVPLVKGVLYVTFTQSEKHALTQYLLHKNFKEVLKPKDQLVSTVHQVQGLTVDRMIVVRQTGDNDDLYTSVPHCIVALSRHVHSLEYYYVPHKSKPDVFKVWCDSAWSAVDLNRVKDDGDSPKHTDPVAECVCKKTS